MNIVLYQGAVATISAVILTATTQSNCISSDVNSVFGLATPLSNDKCLISDTLHRRLLHLPLVSPTLVKVLIRMTDTHAFAETLTLLDVLGMCNLEYTSTRKVIVLFLDLIHDLSHLE